MKVLRINQNTHDALKEYCKRNGLKLNAFVEIILRKKLKSLEEQEGEQDK